MERVVGKKQMHRPFVRELPIVGTPKMSMWAHWNRSVELENAAQDRTDRPVVAANTDPVPASPVIRNPLNNFHGELF